MVSKSKESLSSILAQYSPKPSQQFYERMAKSPWNRKEQRMSFTLVRRLAFVVIFLLVFVVAAILAVPSVRASISSFLGLGISPSDMIVQPTGTVDLSTPVPPTQISETPTIQPAEATAPASAVPAGNVDLSTNSNIQQVNGLAGWNIMTPTYLPEGFAFKSAYYDSTNQIAFLSFLATRSLPGSDLTETKTITLVEAKRNDIVPLMVAPSTSVKDVTVLGAPAAYAIGAWDSNFVQNANEPNGGHMEWNWRNDLPIQNLYWQRGDVYLVLITDDAQITPEVLLQMGDHIGK